MADTFVATTAALVDVLIDQTWPAASPAQRTRVRAYVLGTGSAMPDHFRFGFRVLTFLFTATAFVRHGRGFVRLSSQDRHAHVTRWRQSRLGIFRSMIAFYEAFAAHGLYAAVHADSATNSVRLAA